MNVTQKNPGWLKKLLKACEDGPMLAVGWPVGTSGVSARYPDGTPVLLVAAANNFGAHINHPGGTGYTVTDKGARFQRNDAGPVQGRTAAHVIDIPARDFMTPGGVNAVAATEPIKAALIPALNRGKVTIEGILEHMGPFAQAGVQKAIADLKDPPNAPSTIRQKGSDNPLQDTGQLVQTVTYAVRGNAT